MHRHAASTYINKGEIKILQTLHKTLHSLHISLILRTLHCVGFEAKFLHKPYTEPYMGTKRQRDKETKSQREEETKRQREEELERGRGGAYPNPSLKGRALLRRWCTAHGGLFLGSQRDKERKSGREEAKKNYGKAKKNYGKAKKN